GHWRRTPLRAGQGGFGMRLRSIQLLSVSLLFVVSAAVSPAASPRPKGKAERRGVLPDTPAGRCGRDYIAAFDSGEQAMRKFESTHRAKSALAKRPMDDRITQYKELRDQFGKLEPVRVLNSGDSTLSLLASADGPGANFQLDFQFEEAEPHKLLGIMIRGPVDGDEQENGAAKLDKKSRGEIVNGVADAVDKNYVYPKKAAAMSEMLRSNLKAGRYDQISDANELSQKLTADLRGVCDDKHLAVVPRFNAPEAGGAFDPHRADRDNYGFEKVERLPGNVGYIKFNLFHPGEDAQKVAAAAMNFLGRCDALIFDLRSNGGGSPEMIAFVSGYLFDKSVLLNRFFNRVEDSTTETWSRDDVPGPRFDKDVPV